LLVDTGALYRSVALAARRRGVDWSDERRVGEVAHALAAADAITFVTLPTGGQKIVLDGEDVSTAIRTQEIAEGASRVSAQPEVRAALLEMQRRAGRDGGVVLEGRDIGTVVFPDAEAKFFLTASVEVRAKRRHDELVGRGETPDLATIQQEVAQRDTRDSTRAIAPLRQADDAVLVDSSTVDVDSVVAQIVERVHQIEEQMRGAS
jgi:cytidylate kinase